MIRRRGCTDMLGLRIFRRPLQGTSSKGQTPSHFLQRMDVYLFNKHEKLRWCDDEHRSGRASRRSKHGHVTLSNEASSSRVCLGFAPPDQVFDFHRVTRTLFGFYLLGVCSIRYSLPEELEEVGRISSSGVRGHVERREGVCCARV